MSPIGLNSALKEEGINVGEVGAEKFLKRMEEEGIVNKSDEGTLRTLAKQKKSDTKMQEAGQNAENQTLLTPQIESKLEKMFWNLIRKREFHGMDRRWSKDDLDYYRSLQNRR